MSYDQQGVGIGKYRENGALDVNGLIYSGSKPIQHHRLTEVRGAAIIEYNNTNLDDYRTTGFFSIMSTMKNYPINKPKPTEQVGFLEVIEGLGGDSSIANNKFWQVLQTHSNAEFSWKLG